MHSQSLFPVCGEILPYDHSAILFPNFFSSQEADEAFSRLLSTTPWEEQTLTMFGRQVLEPRLSVWVSDGISYTYSRTTRHPAPWTPILRDIRQKCESETSTQFNGVLANYYRNGRDHMGWHADDEPINGPEPIIASLSFGASRRFDLRHNETKETVSVELHHGSLLLMSGKCQHRWKHRIAKTAKVSEARINLTFRCVDPMWGQEKSQSHTMPR